MQPGTFDLKISAFSFNDVVGPSYSIPFRMSASKRPNARKACNFKAFKSLPDGISHVDLHFNSSRDSQREKRGGGGKYFRTIKAAPDVENTFSLGLPFITDRRIRDTKEIVQKTSSQ